MADKNLENIEYKFESINNLLEAMRAQNAANAGDVDKVLANINLKLDTISDEENTDLIKVFLAELKRSLEERHNFVSSKFVEMEEAYKQLVEKAGESVKAQDIKQVFDIIATNLNVFSKEVFTQKELLNQINTKMEESKLDDTAKKDILKNISLLKVELEKFNNGFESIILNLGSNFQTMSESLLKLDQSEALADVKKDIENIFLSSNAVLSTLQVIDRKNRELEDVLTQVVTKEDFKIEQDQVAKLVAQNIQLSDYISKLPVNEVVEDLNKKIDTTVGVINALKNILSEATDQNQKMLSAQIENLESKIANISSEEEFIGFRKELSDFAAEVMQSSNLMRADLLDTNSELKKLTAFINSSNLKNDFEEIANTVKASENNLAQNISEASSNFIQSALNNKSELEQNIIQSTRQITEKIDATEKTVSENSKSNLTNILDGIQSVISNIFSAKNEINLSNIENSENVEIKIEELQKDLNASKSALIQNSKKNLEEINTNLQAVINFTNETRTLLEGNVAQNSKLVEEKLEELSKKLTEAQNFIDKNSKESTEKISALNEELIAGLNAFKTESQEGATTTAAWVKQTITELTRELEDTKESLETKSKLNFEGLLAKIQGIS
ncbi:MAG TPA: hypothetical protein PLG15_06455, partial [Candidatus Gastranaerophilaceae bacterium]|nr:hypothetical protein [Candidatus Gastranaerophilaceae bacterium]